MKDRMKRKIIIALSVLFALFLGLAPLRIVKTWAVEGDPFTEIGTAEELKALAEDPSLWSGNYKLTADINLNGSADDPWTPIGNNNNSTHFTGIFDGDNHTISGLYIETTGSYQGLFGYVSNGTIKNLTVKGAVIGHGYVGGIVGHLYSTTSEKGMIVNCSFVGTIEGGGTGSSDQSVGGIVGYNHGGTVKECRNSGTVYCGSMYAGGIAGQNEGKSATVIDCENTGTVSLIDSTISSTAGGIAGTNTGSITNCRNKGNIGTGNNLVVGGIAGSNSSSVTQCCNTGTVTGGNYIGGIVAKNSDASVTQCCNTGTVTGSNTIGGIAGLNTAGASIEQCYNLNTVSGTSYIGGVAGQSEGKATVTNCYNKAAVNGTSNVGGLVGKNYGGTNKSPTFGTVTNCYNRGTISNTSSSGGVVGLNKINTSEGTVTNCYYLAGTAKGGIAGSDAVGKAEVKTVDKFNSGEVAWLLQKGNTGNGVWGQELVKNNKDDYPLLIALPEGADNAPDESRTGDNAVPIVVKLSFFVPGSDDRDYMQLSENGSSEYYAQYSNKNGTEGNGIGKIKIPTHSDYADVPEADKDGNPIVWLVNNPNGGREFDTVMKEDIIWGGSKYNEIHLYVKWELGTELGILTIEATGGRPNERFLYHITGTAEDGTELDLTVSVKSGGSTSILVPLGEYTVTEISDWSWRYADGVPTGDDWVTDGKTATTTIEADSNSTYGGQEKTVTYSHARNNKNWLGGESGTYS